MVCVNISLHVVNLHACSDLSADTPALSAVLILWIFVYVSRACVHAQFTHKCFFTRGIVVQSPRFFSFELSEGLCVCTHNTHAHARTHAHTYTHTCYIKYITSSQDATFCSDTYTHTHTHTRHSRTHALTHSHTQTHTHTHMHTCYIYHLYTGRNSMRHTYRHTHTHTY